MSNAGTRALLAAAASSVPGVTCSPYFVQTLTPGHAMVRLERETRSANGFGFVNTWSVVLLLPQALDAAEQLLDALEGALIEALGAELTVTTVTPQSVALPDGSVVPCAVFSGTRERE